MSEEQKNKRILIIGMAGGLAKILAKLILQENPSWEILGIDSRDIVLNEKIPGLKTKRLRYSRGNFENLFRDSHFDTVYHLGRLSHGGVIQNGIAERLDISVVGTNRILDLSLRFKVKKIIILSTFHVYGALSDNSIFLAEDSPLKASIKFPELRDVVEMDQTCTTWMWKYQGEIDSVILRPCNIIGEQINNSMTKFLTSPLALRPIDYNPSFQFIHEFDMAKVLYAGIDKLPTGSYNVATDEFINLREALDLIGSRGIPFPISVASAFNQILKLSHLQVPEYLIDYLKYSCLIDNQLLKEHIGEDFFRFKVEESLKLLANI